MTGKFEIRNPYDNALLQEVEFDNIKKIESSVQKVVSGRKDILNIPAFERSDILHHLAELLQQNEEKLAKLITEESGKTITDSHVEIMRAINTTIASSEEARQISGEVLDSDAYPPARGKLGLACWRPMGTVLCITPFNFPVNIAMHKIGPAFAAGNTMLFKPALQNYPSSKFLTDLCYEAGIPESVLQMVLPDIPDMGTLIKHNEVHAINFTGGTLAAEAIATQSGYKKLLFELGGNDPLIIMPDADVEKAIDTAINHRFAGAGQRCTAAKRVFIHNDVYDSARDMLVEKTSKLKVGNPRKDDTFVGPVISSQSADSVMNSISKAIEGGATVTCGNKRDGNVIYPTILENITADSILMNEEVFGPVIPLYKFNDVDEIIPVINNSPYGLQAGMFTNDLSLSRRMFEELEVGALAINDGPGFRAEHFPFGGVKHSGIGREGIKYAIREMSYIKTLVV